MEREVYRGGRDLCPEDFVGRLGTRHPVIVEVGANDGRDTARFLKIWPGARITAFEPEPRALRRFSRNVPEGAVRLIRSAVSDRDGIMPWYASDGKPPHTGDWAPENDEHWDMSGSVLRPKHHLERCKWVTFSFAGYVQTVRLDSWYAREPAGTTIDLLWVDVQGAEALVILGAEETLKHAHWLYTEYSDDEEYVSQPNREQILMMLPDWRLDGIHASNLLLENTLWTG